jgi:hypothetical protein
MDGKGIENFEEQARARFHRTSTEHYEQWKRTDILEIALNSMPKQVTKHKMVVTR